MVDAAHEVIVAFNQDREPERLARKYCAMARDASKFLRGTCHLFYRRLGEAKLAPGGPRTWICGDLHLENFGTYRADNGLVYFDINDFDEACLAPCSWDILRLVTSLLVAAPSLQLANSQALARRTVETYRDTLLSGRSGWIERKTARGVIGGLMAELRTRDPEKFLDKRTEKDGSQRHLKLDPKQALPITAADRKRLRSFFDALAKSDKGRPWPRFVDAARRIAGTGSLGVPRFVVLLQDRLAPGSYTFIDLKAARPSAVAPASPYAQPNWRNQAERIVTIELQCQAATPGLLRPVTIERDAFILKELQPSADKLDLEKAAGDSAGFADALLDMSRLAAWAQLRASGRGGAANADDLIAYAKNKAMVQEIMSAARLMVASTRAEWQEYRRAYDEGLVRAGAATKPSRIHAAGGKKKAPTRAGASKSRGPKGTR